MADVPTRDLRILDLPAGLAQGFLLFTAVGHADLWVALSALIYIAGRRERMAPLVTVMSLVPLWLTNLPLWPGLALAASLAVDECLVLGGEYCRSKTELPSRNVLALVRATTVALFAIPFYTVGYCVAFLILLKPHRHPVRRSARWMRIARVNITTDRVYKEIQDGNRSGAYVSAMKVLDLARPLENSFAIGRAYHLLAMVLEDSEDWDGALSAYSNAERLLTEYGDVESATRARADFLRFAVIIGDVGTQVALSDTIEMEDGSDVAIGTQVALAVTVREHGDRGIARDRLAAARAEAVETRNRSRVFQCDIRALDWDLFDHEFEGVPLDLDDALVRAKDLADYTARYKIAVEDDTTLTVLARVQRLRGDTEDAVNSGRRGLTRAKKTGIPFLELECLTALAEVMVAGEPDGALELALDAVAVANDLRYGLADSRQREGWAGVMALQFGIALEAAIICGRHGLAAELIESARLQAFPAQVPTVRSQDAREEGLRGGQLAPRAFIAVGGISVLADRAERQQQAVRRIHMEEVLRGTKAETYWWGTYVARMRVFWALVSAEGPVASGIIPADSDGAGLPDLMRRLNEALPGSETVPYANMLQRYERPRADAAQRPPYNHQYSALFRSRAGEQSLSADLGAALLPEPLRRLVAERAHKRLLLEDNPIRLLIAPATSLSRVPFPLLTVEDGTRPARLAEGAIIHFMPPLIFTDAAVTRTQAKDFPIPVSLAVVDPKGDLVHAGVAPATARIVLGQAIPPQHATGPASRANVLAALREVSVAEPSAFFYAGHFAPGKPENILTSGLTLHDGVLSAADILGSEGICGHRLFPARMLVGACSSLSSGETLSDWYGFTAAALRSGCEAVIGTSWAIINLPETATFEHEVLHALTHQRDHAAGLREIQLLHLALWRARDDAGDSALDHGSSSPLIWASYQAVGLPDHQQP